MSKAEGLTRCQKDQRAEKWHDKRMRKKECNFGDKKLITVRPAEQGKLQAKGKDHYESSTLHRMVSLRPNDKGNIQR